MAMQHWRDIFKATLYTRTTEKLASRFIEPMATLIGSTQSILAALLVLHTSLHCQFTLIIVAYTNVSSGRPKGSKNKPKNQDGVFQGTPIDSIRQVALQVPQTFREALQQDVVGAGAGSAFAPNVSSASPVTTPTQVSRAPLATMMTGETPRKSKGGRPKGSRNKPKDPAMQAHMATPIFTGAASAKTTPQQAGEPGVAKRPIGRPRKDEGLNANTYPPGLTPEEQAVIEAYRAVRAAQTPAQSAAPTPAQPPTGEKRKRGRPRRSSTTAASAQAESRPGADTNASSALVTAFTTALAKDTAIEPASVPLTTSAAPVAPLAHMELSEVAGVPEQPPAKRQRKPKEPKASPSKRKNPQVKESASQVPSTIPVSMSSTIPDSTASNLTDYAPSQPPQATPESYPSSTLQTSQTLSQGHPNSSRSTPSQHSMSTHSLPQHTLSTSARPQAHPQSQGIDARYEAFTQMQKERERALSQNQNRVQTKQTVPQGGAQPQNFGSGEPMMQSPTYMNHQSRTPSAGTGAGFGQYQAGGYGQHTTQSSSPMNTFQTSGSAGGSTMQQRQQQQQQQQQQKTFSPQPQQNGHPYNPYSNNAFIDMSALESRNNSNVGIGGSGMGGYGQSVGVNQGNGMGRPGAGTGFNMDGYAGLSGDDLRERLMRGIGRR
jgi:hypothetical protein